MIFEHWVTSDNSTLIPSTHSEVDKATIKGFDGHILCCTIEAPTWEAAMQLYYTHQGWGRYTPSFEEV